MKIITSSHNPIFKQYKRLATEAKFRALQNQTIIEGVRLCKSYLQLCGEPHGVLATKGSLENPEVAEIVRHCEAESVPVFLLNDNLHRALSGVKSGVGVVFVIKIPPAKQMGDISETSVLLDRVQNPANLGAILRTAAAAGVMTAYCSPGTVSAWSPRTLRAGMGANFSIEIYEGVNLQALIKRSKIPVLATALNSSSSIYDKDLSGSVAWLFGNEGQGVSNELMALNVESVIVPQNSNVESLNIAAAAAICLFEHKRQLSSK